MHSPSDWPTHSLRGCLVAGSPWPSAPPAGTAGSSCRCSRSLSGKVAGQTVVAGLSSRVEGARSRSCRRVCIGLQACARKVWHRPAEERLTLADGEGEGARGVVIAISREIVDDVLQEHPARAMPCHHAMHMQVPYTYARTPMSACLPTTLDGHARDAMVHKGGRAVRGWGGVRVRFAHAGAGGRPTAAEQSKVHLRGRQWMQMHAHAADQGTGPDRQAFQCMRVFEGRACARAAARTRGGSARRCAAARRRRRVHGGAPPGQPPGRRDGRIGGC